MALRTIRILSIASGIGGLDLGVKRALHRAGVEARVVVYVEREAYAAAVLRARMADQAVDEAPIWSDLRTFDARRWRGCVDLVVAGYPCQGFSLAGKRLGHDDERSLWDEVLRVIREARPAAVFCENVSAHTTFGFARVVSDMAGLGYTVQACIARASDVGAPHRRERIFWLGVANAGRDGEQRRREPRDVEGETESVEGAKSEWERGGGSVGHRGEGMVQYDWPPGPHDAAGWRAYLERTPGTEPAICRGADGVPDRMDRLRALGNAVVPQQAELAFELLAFGG